MEDFIVLLKRLMIEEKGYSEDDAQNLISKHSAIVMSGIMKGNFFLRATAVALEMKELEDRKFQIEPPPSSVRLQWHSK